MFDPSSFIVLVTIPRVIFHSTKLMINALEKKSFNCNKQKKKIYSKNISIKYITKQFLYK